MPDMIALCVLLELMDLRDLFDLQSIDTMAYKSVNYMLYK